MINVEEALKLVDLNNSPLTTESIQLKDSLGRVLSKNIDSPINMPPFRQSAMDGYAMNWEEGETSFELIGEIPAGSSELFSLKKGECVRIFTGAAVPDDANIVIPQENIELVDGKIISNKEIKSGQHIRPLGESTQKDALAMEKNTKLDPGSIGFLATLGITSVECYKQPRISIIVTGDELIKPGNKLSHGKIFESNSIMLEMATKKYGFTPKATVYLKDDYESTKNSLQKEIEESDMVIITGGISVGDYDFVGKALNEIGCESVFYKVKQKPGKPVYFGKAGKTSIFALPGNPAAALSSFYIYVLPALNTMKGLPNRKLRISQAKLNSDYTKKGDRGQFLKGAESNGEVDILTGQASSMLQSFSLTNSLIYIPSEQNELKKGDLVKIYHLD